MIGSFNHRFGECWWHEGQGIIYINIPKTGSTSIKEVLRQLGFIPTLKFTSKTPPDGTRIFTVIREPIGRYVSGVIEYFKRQDLVEFDEFVDRQLDRIRFRKNLILDEHTAHQTLYLMANLPVTDFILFEELPRRLPELLAELGFDKQPTLPNTNPTDQRLKKKFMDRLTEADKQYIEDFYAPGQLLYRTIKEKA